MKPSYEELEARCAALASELQSVKAMNDCLSEELRGYESDGAFEGPKMHLLWWQCETPNLDAFLAEVRRSAFNDLCAAFVKHKELAGLDDSQEVTVFEATDALLHCAEQLDTNICKGVQS